LLVGVGRSGGKKAISNEGSEGGSGKETHNGSEYSTWKQTMSPSWISLWRKVAFIFIPSIMFGLISSKILSGVVAG
jgi:hypothetical protein